ncbi:MAG TPA: triose-phosphate isomerase [Thermoanaerobaculia bacterium]|nr:triose-phosphate isomerase [Thermoanaerobaculia bacterium]
MHPSRTPLVIANWKMNKTPSEAAVFCDDFLSRLPALPERVELAIAPAFPALERVGRHLLPTRVKLAAQDVHVEPKGAHTGEVSVAMLADVGVAMVLVGHSERRRDRKEVEADFTRKMKRLADAGLSPVYCVGETLEERDGGRTEGVLAAQMAALDAFGDALPPGFVLAYEPVWAIGTGRAATPEMAADAHAFLRGRLAERFGAAAAAATRVLYGGSVTPANAADLFAKPDIDGGLVGGASLVPADFAALAVAAGA